MNSRLILFYVIRILIILTQTSELPNSFKQIRIEKLDSLAYEIASSGNADD